MTSTTQSAYQAGHRAEVRRSNQVREFLSRLALTYRIYRERRALLSLSDKALKDIGLSRSDAYREAYKPVWDIPEDRR